MYRFVATEGCDRNRIWQNCIALFYTGGTAMAYNVQNMLLQCLFSVVLHIRILRYTYIIYIVIFLFPKMRVPLRLQPLLENCSAFTCNTLRRDNLGLVECRESNETATENLHCNQTVTQLLWTQKLRITITSQCHANSENVWVGTAAVVNYYNSPRPMQCIALLTSAVYRYSVHNNYE